MLTMLTYEEILSDLQAYVSAIDPEISTSPDTDVGARIRVLADALMGLQGDLRGVEEDMIPSELTSTAALDRHAASRGLTRLPATTTDEVEDALAVAGTAGSTIDAGTTLVHVDGTRYQITQAATVSSLGAALCTLQSLDTGTACNKDVLEMLAFETPPLGVQSDAQLALALTGATDEETNAELLVRVLDAIRNPHAGGRFSDYRRWAMEIAKVRSAYCYGPSSNDSDGRRGLGAVDVAILTDGTGADRTPSVATVLAVQEYLDACKPAGGVDVLALRPTPVSQDVDVQIEPGAGYEFDWDAVAPGYGVDSWDPATRSLGWDATPPASVAAGVRIMVAGHVATVESVAGTTTVLTDVLASPSPAIGNGIYPAGPLSEPVQEAIAALFDTLGPAKGTAYDPEHVGWEDALKISKLHRAVLGVTGVEDVEVITPAASVAPTDHADPGTVDFLYPGVVTVRPIS